MAMTIKEIRDKYPDYDDLSDQELANKIHTKFYSDLPKDQVYTKLGLNESSIARSPFSKLQDEDHIELSHTKPIESTGITGLISDVARGIGNAYQGSSKFASETPQMLEDLGGELLEHPVKGQIREAAQLGAGAADVGKAILNSPHDLLKYFIRKHLAFDIPIPGTNWHTSDLIPHVPEDTGVEKLLGLQPTKGERLVRKIPEIATDVYGGKALLKSAKRVIQAPSKERLFQRALEERINQAAEKKSVSETDLKALQDALTLDYSTIHGKKLGTVEPVPLREGINIAEHKLAEKKPLTEIPFREVGEIPPEPDLKAIVNEKKVAVERAKEEADKALGTLDTPRLKGAEKVTKAINDVHKSASDLYRSARQHYVDKQISADNTAEIKSVTDDLEALKNSDELAPGYGAGTAEQKALESQLEALKEEKVNASDIFDLQRTVEKIAEDTRKKQYSGVNDIEFKRLNGVADRLESHADTLATRLESVGGKEVQAMITEANKGWKTYKDLSKRNPVGKGALKGEIPMRSMIEIAKTHPGNDFLKALVDSDPELKKQILASYAGESSAAKLLKPTSLVKKYIQGLPEVEEHVNSLKQALQGVKEGEVRASKVKKEYDDLVTSMKEAAKEQKIRQDAIKESDKLNEQIKFKREAIPKIEAKMKELDTHSAEHKRLQKELEDHKKFIQDKGGRLKELAAFFVKVKGANLVHL